MAISFLSQNRTVLLVSDEALCIYSMGARGARLIETVPWAADNFERNVASIISKECGRRPVLILNDMVEQHYRKERIIKTGVGMLDKTTMLKRKLHVAFSNYPVRAAMPLKEKVVKTETQSAADVYIFAAVPASKQFTQTVGSVRLSLASVAGFCLLPIESSDMVKLLSDKLRRNKKTRAKWSVFMGQHQNGSLRQIVTKNGELALTRMSPIVDSDDDPNQWAHEVHQEFNATMSYLARFGYGADDGLDVTVIANPASGEILEGLLSEDCEFHALTLPEAARLLNVTVGVQQNQRYADPLHVAWAGRKKKLILPMKAAQVDEVSRPRQAALAISVLLLCSVAFLGYQILERSQELFSANNDLNLAKQNKTQLDALYQKEVQRKEALGFDVRLVQSSIAVHKELDADNIRSLSFFRGVGRALGRDLKLDKIEVERPGTNIVRGIVDAVSGEKGGVPLYIARLQMTYPGTTDVEKGNKEVSDLKTRLEKVLPHHQVEVMKYLKDYEYTGGIIVETGDLETQGVNQDFVSEILIKGPASYD